MKKQKSSKLRFGGGIIRFGLWFNDEKIAIGIVIFFIATIIPMLVVAQYSHASADDFGWGAGMRRQVWEETHSIIQFLVASFKVRLLCTMNGKGHLQPPLFRHFSLKFSMYMLILLFHILCCFSFWAALRFCCTICW